MAFAVPWPLVPLRIVAQIVRGVTFTSGETHGNPTPGYLPVLRAGNITERLIVDQDLLWIPEDRVSAEQRLRLGDIAICMSSGSGSVVGKTAILESNWDGCVGAFCAIIRSRSHIHSSYLAAYLKGTQFTQWRRNQAQGANIQNLRMSDLEAVLIPLPPLSEQLRIVEILHEAEEISRLRETAEIRRAQIIPAVFDSMFGDPIANPQRWDMLFLSDLINGTPKNGIYKSADFYGDGTPIIRIGDFSEGILRNTRKLQRVRLAETEIEPFRVSNGQILINRVNSIEHLAKSLLIKELIEPTVFESNMMRLDPKRSKLLPDYFIACLQHPSVVAQLRAKAKKAINQASINQKDVLTLQIPVPPLLLQQRFSDQVDAVEALKVSGEQSLLKENAMRASLISAAFCGQLTADWREARSGRLTAEARERDAALQAEGVVLAHVRRDLAQAVERASQLRSDGIHAELNHEQRELLLCIRQRTADVRPSRYFTAYSLSNEIEGPLRRNPRAIDGHLSVLAARGIIIPVSREELTADTREFVFGNGYRLPKDGSAPGDSVAGAEGDKIRLREIERLASLFEKERKSA